MAAAKQNILTDAADAEVRRSTPTSTARSSTSASTSTTCPIEPGKDVQLTHYWKLVAPPGEDWKTFTHLNGAEQDFINADHAPVKGKYPVGAWKAGEIIRDQHTIRLPAGWAAPTVEVYVGLWRGPTRMPVKAGPHDAEGRVLAASIPVSAKPAGGRGAQALRRAHGDQGAEDRRQAGRRGWASAPSTGAFVNTMTGTAGAA